MGCQIETLKKELAIKRFLSSQILQSIFFSNSRSYKSITSNVPVQNFGPDVILYETGVRMSSVATADES